MEKGAGYDLHGIAGEGPCEPERKSKERLKHAYTEMMRIRVMEELSEKMYRGGKIRGFCHLSVGQEAIPVGMSLALRKEDTVLGSYRCHGYALVTGLTPREIFCELVGSSEGCSKGKGGSMHLYSDRFLGGHGIVGAQAPLGLGVAFAEKYRRLEQDKDCMYKDEYKSDPEHGWTIAPWKKCNAKRVTVVVFGDGAANQGQVYESYNMASLWSLPIIFICENNKYGMGTCVSRASAADTFYDRVKFVPGIRVDGTEVFRVEEAVKFARNHALSKGPIIVEMQTYRYTGHSMTDAFTGYRTDEEVAHYEKNDCLVKTQHMLREHMGAEEVQDIRDAVVREMKKAKDEALSAARCDPEDLYTDVLLKSIHIAEKK